MIFGLPLIHLTIERWKYNADFGLYVSSLGNFRDKNRAVIHPKIGSNGYLLIKVKGSFKLAHRIVALTFLPIDNANSFTIDHKNHNKRDNRLKNLEWVTKEENIRRARVDLISTPSAYKFKANAPIVGPNNTIYANLDEAANTLCKQQKLPYLDTPKKKIKNSINNGSLYYGVRWKMYVTA